MIFFSSRLFDLPMARIWIATPNRRVWFRLHRDDEDLCLREVRDRVLVPLSFSTVAQWSDPREQLGLQRVR